MTKLEKLSRLSKQLSKASELYHGDGEPIMSDSHYDELYSELQQLQYETGIISDFWAKVSVGYSVGGEDIASHTKPILSLKSTKRVDDILEFIGNEKAVLSRKLDGISLVLYYKNGVLTKALTRGDGKIGKDVTKSAYLIPSIPKKISSEYPAVIRGEACMSFRNFDTVNILSGRKYRNPRNLVSGIMNTKGINKHISFVEFIAHTIVKLEDGYDTFSQQLTTLSVYGFDVVEWFNVDISNITGVIGELETDDYIYPTDGLVITYEDLYLQEIKGSTNRHPRYSMAFKWKDICKETTLLDVKWSVSNKGVLTPIAIFKSVDIEGSTVSRVNLHNLRIFENLRLGIGDRLLIFKANKIVPDVERNIDMTCGIEIPKVCPVCGKVVVVVNTKTSKMLYCIRCDKGEELYE